jgi:hypothetical protein
VRLRPSSRAACKCSPRRDLAPLPTGATQTFEQRAAFAEHAQVRASGMASDGLGWPQMASNCL